MGNSGFPFADGLAADAQPSAQLLLGDPHGLSILTDPLTQGHGGHLLLYFQPSVCHIWGKKATTCLSNIGCGRKKSPPKGGERPAAPGPARPAGEISRTPYAKAEKYATILLTNFVYAGGYWVWQSLFISGSY